MTYLEQLTEQGDKENMDAVLQVSMAANTSAYDEIRKESRHMCEAFQELFKEEIDEKVKAGERRGRLEGEREGRLAGEREGRLAGEREGRREGEREGRLATLIGLAKDNLITISEAAKRAEMTEALFIERMTNFGK
jgi:chemotaxis response regulator CheB